MHLQDCFSELPFGIMNTTWRSEWPHITAQQFITEKQLEALTALIV